MSKRQTQIDKIIKRIREVGYVDNFWAIDNYILRLGALIYKMKKRGWDFKGKHGVGKHKKNYFYIPTKQPASFLYKCINCGYHENKDKKIKSNCGICSAPMEYKEKKPKYGIKKGGKTDTLL